MRECTRRRSGGFSLLELLVAFSIMAMSLTLLYRVTGGSASTVGETERYAGALMLAESLLESRDAVAPEGWIEAGEEAGYRWQVKSAELATDREGQAVDLHRVQILVEWDASGRNRRFELVTALPGALPDGARTR